jgi:hypothetical protein
MGNNPEIWWLSAGLLLIIGDLLASSFFLLFLGAGALITGIAAAIGVENDAILWLIFALSSAFLAMLLRKPLLSRFGPQKKSLYNEHEGQIVEIADIENDLGPAKAKYRGSMWPVRSASGQTLELGQKLKVLSLDGITLVVD